jgi:glutathione S-transferase
MATSTPRLIYFDLRGRGEVVRLIFEELGETYDDERVTQEAWAEMKPRTPFGALPILEDGELTFAQCQAIYNHLARTRGLYGESEADKVACDVACEAFDEAIGEVWGAFWSATDELPEFEAGKLAAKLAQLERWYLRGGSDTGHWVGRALSLADVFAFRYLDEVDAFFPAALARAPALARFHAAFAARPRIAAYIASGRRPPLFGVGLDGPKIDRRT